MKKWVFCLVIGIAMLALGARSGSGSSQVTCGSEVMSPGDVCEETRGGVTTDTETYEEKKAGQEAAARTFNSWGRWALLGGGGVLTVGGIIGIIVVRRRRAAQGTAQPQGMAQPAGYHPPAAAGYQQPPTPSFGPGQGFPGQGMPPHQVPPGYQPPPGAPGFGPRPGQY